MGTPKSNITIPTRDRFRIGWELETNTFLGAKKGERVKWTGGATTVTRGQIMSLIMQSADYTFHDTVSYEESILRRILITIFKTVPRTHKVYAMPYITSANGPRTINPEATLGQVVDWFYNGDTRFKVWHVFLYVADVPEFIPTLLEETKLLATRYWDRNGGEVLDAALAGRLMRELSLPIAVEHDGTVTGVEFHPSGPMPVDESLELYNKFYNLFGKDSGNHRNTPPFQVGTGCSFHIHVSVDGLKHKYGRNMQAWMYLFILENIDRVPLAVIKRWATQTDQYFKLQLGGGCVEDNTQEEKYSFISYRNEWKTWEFRGWGNLRLPEDAKACAELSVEAYQYAFKKVHIDRELAPMDRIANIRENVKEIASSIDMYGVA